MNKNKTSLSIALLLMALGIVAFSFNSNPVDERILSFTVDPKIQEVKLYWKDEKGKPFQSIQNLKDHLESQNKNLLFAMNGGMYLPDGSPQGLFIQENKTLSALDTAGGNGNFYMKPNGIFYLMADNTPHVCATSDFSDNDPIKYATQSGPMLVINGQIHPAFKKESTNLNIRNGVGILPNNKIIFAISKTEINFYEFAEFFLNLGCQNALYLDGFVSRAYYPKGNWIQKDGQFGVMIGVTE
jgi:uncharacterized protein YigE (DUF2233 family)